MNDGFSPVPSLAKEKNLAYVYKSRKRIWFRAPMSASPKKATLIVAAVTFVRDYDK